MFAGLGTIINVAAILIGSTIGIAVGVRFKEDAQRLTTDILGLITALGAVSALTPLWSSSYKNAFPEGGTLLLILLTMLVGGLIGSALHLESRLDHFGEFLRKKFRASSESPFVDGFVTASLLFVIGPLAILGSISDGMGNGLDQLILKSSLDFFAALAFSASLGWGVAASFIPVGIYQGAWTLVGLAMGEILSDFQIDTMTICGGLMLIGISLRLLNIKKIAVGNLLPALFLAPITAALLHSLV